MLDRISCPFNEGAGSAVMPEPVATSSTVSVLMFRFFLLTMQAKDVRSDKYEQNGRYYEGVQILVIKASSTGCVDV